MRASIIACFAVGFLSLSAGCATPSMTMQVRAPHAVAFEGADKLVLVDGEGLVEARQLANRAVAGASSGAFVVTNRGPEGIKLQLHPDRTATVDDPKPIGPTHMYVRVDPVVWLIDSVVDPQQPATTVLNARVVLQVSMASHDGKVRMREQAYEGRASSVASPTTNPTQLLAQAAQLAATAFIVDIKPITKKYIVPFDHTDSGQARILDGTEKGPITASIEAMRKYISYSNENNAIAHYNLAVMLDYNRQYTEAIKEYDQAMSFSVARPFYPESRLGCLERQRIEAMMFGAKPIGDAPAAP
jgi:hypothetical protein